jgi:hypothetical protein
MKAENPAQCFTLEIVHFTGLLSISHSIQLEEKFILDQNNLLCCISEKDAHIFYHQILRRLSVQKAQCLTFGILSFFFILSFL